MCIGGQNNHQSLQSHRTVRTPPTPIPATILRHCRCVDCGHWVREPYNECAHGIIRNGVQPVLEFPPDAWHWCALYDGPQISRDVWLWAKAGAGANKRPVPGRGRTSNGPIADRPGGNRSEQPNHRHPAAASQVPVAPATPRAAQVGAGSTIADGVDGEADRAAVSIFNADG